MRNSDASGLWQKEVLDASIHNNDHVLNIKYELYDALDVAGSSKNAEGREEGSEDEDEDPAEFEWDIVSLDVDEAILFL